MTMKYRYYHYSKWICIAVILISVGSALTCHYGRDLTFVIIMLLRRYDDSVMRYVESVVSVH